MQFNRRNINKRLRNGDIISSSLYSSNSSGGSSSGGILSGNYLPATQNADGTYTVDLTQVNFNGNIIASGEVSAYGSGSTSGNTSVGTIDIEDHLNSTRTDAALSANQGRLLKELIDNVEVDLSDYYNKSQIDNKLSNLNVDLSNYYNKIQIDEKLENLDDYYKKQEVDNKLNNKLDKSTWNDVFSIDSNGNLKIKVDVIGEGEISAYGSGTTASTEINLGNYYTKDEVDDLLDNIDIPTQEIDLTNYYTKSQMDSKLSNKSDTRHTHTEYSPSSHTHSLSELTSTAHTHNYTSVIKLGDKEYNVSNNVISLPSYPTLSSLSGVSTSSFNTHTSNTTSHITSAERTKWNNAVTSSHTHSNKSVLDGITSTKVANWDKVYEDWNDVFTIDSNGNLKVKVNLIGEKDVSAYGSGSTSDSGIGVIDIVDNLTSTATTAALSANQGRVLKNLIDNIDVGNIDVDLSDYYTKEEVNNSFASSNHNHSVATTSASGFMSAADKTKLDGITASADSVSFTRSLTAGTKVGTITINGTGTDIYCQTNTDTTYSNATTSASGLMSASDKSKLDGITASADSVSFTRSLTAGTKVGTITINGTATDLYCEKNTDTNTTYSNATTSASGLMSASDKSKLDGITASADSVSFSRSLTAGTKVGTITINGTATDLYCQTNTDTTYSVVGANGTTGLVKNGSSVTNASGYIACPIVGGVPYYKDTNTTYSLSSFGITATAAELNYCDGVTSNIQTQLNSKSASGHSHNYAGSSSAGGAATSANKLNTNGGSATQPVYFSNGVPVTCTTYANASVNYANSAGSAGSATNATNATTASKLSTVSKTAWGQTFWTSGGIPTSISGNMTGVGSISASGAITSSSEITAYSDARLKTDIQPLKNRGYVTPYTYIKDGKQQIGFLAQEMQQLYPELVLVDEDSKEKYLSVNYMQYTAVLQKQILDLKDEINELKKIIKDKDIN